MTLESIESRPVQLTAPEFKRKAFVLDYETLTQGMEANNQPALRYALFLRDAIFRQRNEDKVQIRGVRIVEYSICTECGGFIDRLHDSHISEGIAERLYFHFPCYTAKRGRMEGEDD